MCDELRILVHIGIVLQDPTMSLEAPVREPGKSSGKRGTKANPNTIKQFDKTE